MVENVNGAPQLSVLPLSNIAAVNTVSPVLLRSIVMFWHIAVGLMVSLIIIVCVCVPTFFGPTPKMQFSLANQLILNVSIEYFPNKTESGGFPGADNITTIGPPFIEYERLSKEGDEQVEVRVLEYTFMLSQELFT